MKKEALIFAITVVVSLVAATIGHMYNPAFCIATKPMCWPFVVLAVMLTRRAVIAIRNRHR